MFRNFILRLKTTKEKEENLYRINIYESWCLGMNEWISELSLDMMSEVHRELAEIIGIENFLKLVMYTGGTSIYIPKAEHILCTIRDKKIKEEYKGDNFKELSKKYGLTERWIREIIRK